jgi:hypothetical protein
MLEQNCRATASSGFYRAFLTLAAMLSNLLETLGVGNPTSIRSRTVAVETARLVIRV